MNFTDDEKLLELIKKEDSDAFEKLFHLYNKRIYAFALNLLTNSSDAEDIVQDVFIAVWNQRKQISISVVSYLFGIARHKIYDFIKRKLNNEAFIEYYLHHNQDYAFVTENDVLYRELTSLFEQLLLLIPERRRKIFLLNRMHGMSYKQIAAKLDISENTVDTQIRHALDFLRQRLKSH